MIPDRLALSSIDKRFGGVHALRGADLAVRAGEIHALCGENGAGKSTLLKVLCGVYAHGTFRGEVRLDGQPLRLRGVQDGRRAGIAVVHQELLLVPGMTVADNLLLQQEGPGGLFAPLSQAEVLARARDVVARFPFAADLPLRARVADLGTGLKQLVEIVRALALDARVLVLDEPTAALTDEEAGRLHGLLRTLASSGTTCLYVSHRLDEVFSLCQRVTVLRDGRTVATADIGQTSVAQVVEWMVGRPVQAGAPRPLPVEAPTVLQVDGLSLDRPGGPAPLSGINLTVRAGEVVGACGAMGSGRTALLSTLFGCGRGRVRGAVRVMGRPVPLSSPDAAIAAGVALVPEDRKGQGLVLPLSIADNLALPRPGPAVIWRPGEERRQAEETATAVSLRGQAGLSAPVSTLSGGNQQKVALGKWLSLRPRVILLDEPTRGVDVGAREEIYALIERLCQQGAAVLLASSDLQEITRLCHRVLVLRGGQVVAERGAGVSQGELAQLLTTGAAA